ncbi:MAG TPA: MFS transporter, partial [Phototrophicaceae bacterium]|nr:MFS transporter [Phototrophicaceae bacterium]
MAVLRNTWRTLRGSFDPLRHRNLRIYLGGQTVSLVGTWLQTTAQGWLVWTLTQSNEALAIVAMLNALPILLFGPWAGVWAERLDRRKVLIGTQIAQMLLAFALALLVQTNTAQIWEVYLLSFLLGAVTALDLPSQQTFLGDLSGMGEVRKAVNLNSMILQVSRMVGPALAGWIVAQLGLAPSFWLNGLSFLAVIATLVAVRSKQVRGEQKHVQPLRDLWEALQFLRTQPRMQDLFLFSTLIVFLALSIVFSQLPAVAASLLNGDASTLGILQAASGTGALIGVLVVIPVLQTMKRIGMSLGLAVIWVGVWLVIFSMARTLLLSSLALLLGSIGAPTVVATALGMVQFMSPADMRSRILGLFTMIIFGLQTVAILVVGIVADKFGVAAAIEINGVLMIVGAAALL